ncbi:MAG TPA: dCTP deaminase [Candidatus Binatia bacterium]|nr:dCTP deaminase [Candidatus Binatia bacterium]
MSIKSDRWIRRMAAQGMIEPFEPGQVRSAENGRIISYGTSSYGYDVRCASEFKIFTNINSTIVDPKKFDEKSFVDVHSEICIIPPNSFALARTVEYFRIPRSVLTICLGKSTYARCFSGDTRVALADGTAPTLEAMVRRHEDGEVFRGYSIGPNGRVIVTRLEAPRFIARDSLIEIELDNRERIQATPDHPFMRRDGQMAAADDLRPGDSLMARVETPGQAFTAASGGESIDKCRNGATRQNVALLEECEASNGQATSRPSLHVGRGHRVRAVRDIPGLHDTYCLTVPAAGNFALEAGVFVHNCGIIVNVTPLEPEWEGHVTLEFSNTTPLPAKIYANEGAAQMVFFESDEVCETSYKDRGGKYQGQKGVTLPKA